MRAAPRRWIAVAGLGLAGLLLPRIGAAGEPAQPRSCQVGAYLISLHDFDFARGSFGADLWFWSTCPSADLRPLDAIGPVVAVASPGPAARVAFGDDETTVMVQGFVCVSF